MVKKATDPAIVRSIHVLGAILADLVEVTVEAEAIARKDDQNAAILLLDRIEPRLQAAGRPEWRNPRALSAVLARELVR